LLHAGGKLHELDADGPAVGMVPELPYDTRTVAVPEGATLLIYSDGVFEIEKPDGQMWAYPEFVAHIGPELARGGDLIQRHLAFARGMCNADVLGDDFSMVAVRF
jgi:sigma-B regulation protein RsbU (phosphoserine phosphatase)